MPGDFNKILTTEQYTTLLVTITDLVKDMVKGLDPALALGTANIPANALRWNSTNKYWEKYNGTVWSAMSANYAITITGSAAKWTAGRTIALTGDVTGTSVAFDGSANLSFATTLATVPATKGGTGLVSYAVGDIPYASTTTQLAKLADVAVGNVLLSGGVGVAPAYGKVGLTTHISGTLAAVNGGTGMVSYAVGDIPYASTTTQLAKLADVAVGNVLLSGGVGVAPAYGKVGLTTHISGTLAAVNGGTGMASYVVGDIPYASTTTQLSKLADVAVGNVLLSGGVGVAPAYGKVGLTTHISGTLAVANGGTGGTTAATARSGIGAAAAGAIGSAGLTQNTGKLLGRTTAGVGAPEEIMLGSGLWLSGGALFCTVPAISFSTAAENAAGVLENKAVDPLGIREAFNASGAAPVYACRAWANFNWQGTIRASGNVSSVTMSAWPAWRYTINFTTAMPDVNYSVSCCCDTLCTTSIESMTTTSVVIVVNESGPCGIITFAIFR